MNQTSDSELLYSYKLCFLFRESDLNFDSFIAVSVSIVCKLDIILKSDTQSKNIYLFFIKIKNEQDKWRRNNVSICWWNGLLLLSVLISNLTLSIFISILLDSKLLYMFHNLWLNENRILHGNYYLLIIIIQIAGYSEFLNFKYRNEFCVGEILKSLIRKIRHGKLPVYKYLVWMAHCHILHCIAWRLVDVLMNKEVKGRGDLELNDVYVAEGRLLMTFS